MNNAKLRFDVTQDDIDNGAKGSPWGCPVARAIERRYGSMPCFPTVGRKVMKIRLANSSSVATYPTPTSVEAFVTAFDRGETVAPTTFWLRDGKIEH